MPQCDSIELIKKAKCGDEAAREKADVVIADLPCSGLGVIGRKSDIKYRMTPEQVADTPASYTGQYLKKLLAR